MKYNYVSVFSGAGGLDIGLERAGLKAISLCEIEKSFCETLEVNAKWTHVDGHNYFKKTKIINKNILDVSITELTRGEKEIDLVVGGPPCQAFSSSGKQLSVLDPRGSLIHKFVETVGLLKPKVFLLENVRGLVTARDKDGKPGGVIKDIILQLEELGYSVRAGLLNAADYGWYQRRVRCFLIGSKKGIAPELPVPTHSKTTNMLSRGWKTLGDFLSEFSDSNFDNFVFPSDKLAPLLNDIPNGSGIKSPGKPEPTRPNGHWGYRQGTFIADLNMPARTVTGSASQDWIRWNNHLRRLTLNEVKLLQGFPSDWEIIGTKAERFKQIGNAVPAVFGEKIGENIIKYLANYPKNKPEKLEFPKSFEGYIDYTNKDHARNKSARTSYKHFDALNKENI